jgi:Fe2+ or Zn2+ uptake regulation protein
MATSNTRHDTASPPTETRATDYYRLRSNRQRRATLEVLTEGTRSLSIDELAEAVAERTPAETTVDQVKIRLHHANLPLLADAGVVDYDREEGTVTVTEPVSDLLV